MLLCMYMLAATLKDAHDVQITFLVGMGPSDLVYSTHLLLICLNCLLSTLPSLLPNAQCPCPGAKAINLAITLTDLLDKRGQLQLPESVQGALAKFAM